MHEEGCRGWAAPGHRLAPCTPQSHCQAPTGMSPLLHNPTVLGTAFIPAPPAKEELRVLGVAPWRLLQGSGTRTASLDGEDHAHRSGSLTVKFGAGGIAAEPALGPHSPGTDKSTGRGPCYRKRVVLSLGLAWLVSALREELCITQRAAATAALVARCHLIGVARSRLPRPPEHP